MGVRPPRRTPWAPRIVLGLLVVTAAWGVWGLTRRSSPFLFDLANAPLPDPSPETTERLLDRVGPGGFRVLAEGQGGMDTAARVWSARFPWARVRGVGRPTHARVSLPESGAFVRRTALVTLPGGGCDIALLVSEKGRLSFAHGVLGEKARVRCRWAVVEPDGRRTVLSTNTWVLPDLNASRGDRGGASSWRSEEIDLSPWAGRLVRLEWRVEKIDGGSSSAPPLVFLADPVLLAPARPRPLPRPKNPLTDADVVLTVLENATGIGVGLDGFSASVPPALKNIFMSGVGVRRFYTNATETAGAWPVLLTGVSGPAARAPLLPGPWVASFRQRGYRTVAVGAFGSADLVGPLGDAFDEIVTVPHDGRSAFAAVTRARAQWGAHRKRGPLLMVVYLRGAPRRAWPPARFWALSPRTFPWSREKWSRWRENASAAAVDAALAAWLKDLESPAPDAPLVGVVSLAGSVVAERPVWWPRRDRRTTLWWAEPGLGLREIEIRGLWCWRHPTLPAGRLLAQTAQLRDVGPSLLALVGHPPLATATGRALNFRRESPWVEETIPIAVRGRAAKALLVDGHYKYIRHHVPLMRRWHGRAFRMDYPREEIFDVWVDPEERINLTAQRRTLLGRLRQTMDELEPDPVDVTWFFAGGGNGQRWDGAVSGALGGLRITSSEGVETRAYGRYEFSFGVTGSTGTLMFQTTPSNASHMSRLTINGRFFPAADIRVSRLGLPLFESTGDTWHDRTKFPWMEGVWHGARLSERPRAWLGRQEHEPALWRPAADRLEWDVAASSRPTLGTSVPEPARVSPEPIFVPARASTAPAVAGDAIAAPPPVGSTEVLPVPSLPAAPVAPASVSTGTVPGEAP